MGLASASNNATNAAALRGSVPKETVIGLFRDLRGIATATNSRRTYGGWRVWAAFGRGSHTYGGPVLRSCARVAVK